MTISIIEFKINIDQYLAFVEKEDIFIAKENGDFIKLSHIAKSLPKIDDIYKKHEK